MNPEQLLQIYAMRREGHTLSAIAKAFDSEASIICTLCKAAGVVRGPLIHSHAYLKHPARKRVRDILKMLESGRYSFNDIAASCGVSRQYVQQTGARHGIRNNYKRVTKKDWLPYDPPTGDLLLLWNKARSLGFAVERVVLGTPVKASPVMLNINGVTCSFHHCKHPQFTSQSGHVQYYRVRDRQSTPFAVVLCESRGLPTQWYIFPSGQLRKLVHLPAWDSPDPRYRGEITSFRDAWHLLKSERGAAV